MAIKAIIGDSEEDIYAKAKAEDVEVVNQDLGTVDSLDYVIKNIDGKINRFIDKSIYQTEINTKKTISSLCIGKQTKYNNPESANFYEQLVDACYDKDYIVTLTSYYKFANDSTNRVPTLHIGVNDEMTNVKVAFSTEESLKGAKKIALDFTENPYVYVFSTTGEIVCYNLDNKQKIADNTIQLGVQINTFKQIFIDSTHINIYADTSFIQVDKSTKTVTIDSDAGEQFYILSDNLNFNYYTAKGPYIKEGLNNPHGKIIYDGLENNNFYSRKKHYFDGYLIVLNSSNTNVFLYNFKDEKGIQKQKRMYQLSNPNDHLLQTELPDERIQTIVIKKITTDRRLQFYMGAGNGFYYKFMIDLETFTAKELPKQYYLMYMNRFIDGSDDFYKNTVSRIVADSHKNTERILVGTANYRNIWVRLYDENMSNNGSYELTRTFDALENQKQINARFQSSIDNTNTQLTKVSNRVTSLEESQQVTQDLTAFDLNTKMTPGIFTFTSLNVTNAPSDFYSLVRSPNEDFILKVEKINAVAVTRSTVLQTLFITSEYNGFEDTQQTTRPKIYYRTYVNSIWSNWYSVGLTTVE